MTTTVQLREFFLAPGHMGFEGTLKQISKAMDCDDEKSLGVSLWHLANATHELHCEKNADGKNAYRWNDKQHVGGGRCEARPPAEESAAENCKIGSGEVQARRRAPQARAPAHRLALGAHRRWGLRRPEDAGRRDRRRPGARTREFHPQTQSR
jgi:hypothetical protein